MKLERLDLRQLVSGDQIQQVVAGRVFMPARTKVEEPPPPPPPPTFSEAQMLESEREGYKKGFAAGQAEGQAQEKSEQAEVNRQLAAMLESFASSITPLYTHYRDMVGKLQHDVPSVALAIAKKVAGDALDANGSKVVSDIAMRCCEVMIAEPEITITVNEAMADTLEQQLHGMSGRLPATTHIVIIRDPGMPRSDCRIEWKNGSLQRITQAIWNEVERAVGNMAAINDRETETSLNQLQSDVNAAPRG